MCSSSALRPGTARGVAIAVACEKKLRSILARAGSGRDPRRHRRGLPIGDLPLMLGSEDTPPRGRSRRAKASLESWAAAPYQGHLARGLDLARRRELGQDPSLLMKAIAPALLGKRCAAGPARHRSAAGRAAGRRGEVRRKRCKARSIFRHWGRTCPSCSACWRPSTITSAWQRNMHFLAGLGKTSRCWSRIQGEWRWMRRATVALVSGFETYRQPAGPGLDNATRKAGRSYFDKGSK